nr:AAA family ATPase [Agrobacterium pusense]
MENEKDAVGQLLNDLDPNIVGVEMISEGSSGHAQLALRHRQSGIAPLHVFGDGLRRALMIALAILQCRRGVMLLDEIEAALHVSAIGKIFPWLENACKEHEVQMIGTTHSLEAIDAVAGSMNTDGVAAFHIDAKRNTAKRYSKDMLRRLVHDRGLDIR